MSEHVQRIHTNFLKSSQGLPFDRQICVSEPKEAKNLATVETPIQEKAQGESTAPSEAIKGKILEYAWHLKVNGKAEDTIKSHTWRLCALSKIADLYDPQQVKEALAKANWSNRTKNIMAQNYDDFLKWLGKTWQRPKYLPQEKLPFIPTEEELNQMIAAAGKKLAALLQLLKETGMRISEARKLSWTDIDFQRRIIKITPSKGSKPRILPISEKAINMLGIIPRKAEKIFPVARNVLEANLSIQRRRIAKKLNNPRILKIGFHTFRHWKGTIEYHKTKDIIHVQQILGHKAITSTMLYINLENALFQSGTDEFHVKTASTVEEAAKLIEVGFEFVVEHQGTMIFRKRK
jgi:integrase